MATTYKKLKYDNSECAVQYAYEAGKATCDSNGKEIASTYYDLSKNINVVGGNGASIYEGYKLGDYGAYQGCYYRIKGTYGNVSTGYLCIYEADIEYNNAVLNGAINISGLIGGWQAGNGELYINISIPNRDYGGYCRGYYYSMSTDTWPKGNIFFGIINNKLTIYVQCVSIFYFDLEVKSSTISKELSMLYLTSLPTLTKQTTLSDQISAGNVKNLLA